MGRHPPLRRRKVVAAIGTHPGVRAMRRSDGYLPIRDYAAIGDGRTVALVGRDGSIDWLCLPDLDSASVFGALLDERRGGRFIVAPQDHHESERRYLPNSNVLATTFKTATGAVRVTDALTLPGRELSPYRELARRVEGISGQVRMRWSVEPHFGYGTRETRFAVRGGVPVAATGADAVAVSSWDAGEGEVTATAVSGSFRTAPARTSLIVLSAAHQEPLVFPTRV